MVHKEQYQRIADAVAADNGGYALHIGKVGDDEFVYSLRTACSSDYDPKRQTLITVKGDEAKSYDGDAADAVLARTDLREFSTGRAIYKRYQVLVKNNSAVIGDPCGYARTIVDAVATKAIKPTMLYQYLELAEHYHKKLHIEGSTITLV